MITKWELLSKKASAERINTWSNLPSEGWKILMDGWDQHSFEECPASYHALRTRLVDAYETAREEVRSGDSVGEKPHGVYEFEYRFAMQVYTILNEEGMTNRTASDDAVWRFLSIHVVPDLVYDRWHSKTNPREFNEKRFYSATRRIWLKVLWWFVYLCWQGDYETTKEMIKVNTADEISQLVERAGRGGYRVDLFREIMRHYDCDLSDRCRKEEKNLLSRVLQLNIARSAVIEPDLAEGGVAGYTADLFGYFLDKE